MTADGPDELRGGTGRELPRFPRWLQAVGALALGLAVVATVARGYDSRTADRPPPAATSTPGSAAGRGQPSPVSGPLRAPELCVETTDRLLTVQFTIENAAINRVTVLSVTAHLPIGGLHAAGVELPSRRFCGRPVDPATRTVLEPGQRVPVTMQFRLPDRCPAPYPVYADVAFVGRSETPGTQQLALLPDLGGYDFTSCARQSTR